MSSFKSHAQQAFEQFHDRKPQDTNQDAEEMEQLIQLYANCCFSPLSKDAPLITEPDDNPPPSEYVLPAGYVYRQTPDTHDANGECIDHAKADVDSTPTKSRRGRPKKRKRRTIHDRLKLKQRRRASRCNILGLTWEQYSPLVHRIAEQWIQQRQPAAFSLEGSPAGTAAFRSPSDTVSPPEDPEDGSTSTFKRAIKDFGHWLATEAAEAFSELLTLRAILPRSPSDSSDTLK